MKLLRFKDARKKCGLTQEQVAKEIGISRAAYTNIENGKRECDYSTLINLAVLYNTSVDSLIGYEPLEDDIATVIADNQDHAIQEFETMCKTVSATTLDKLHTILFTLKRIQKNDVLDVVSKQFIFACIAEIIGRIEIYVDLDGYKQNTRHSNILLNGCNTALKDIVDIISDFTNDTPQKENILIPFYSQPASAGLGTYLFDTVDAEWVNIPKTEISQNADFLLEVRGDSMSPKFCDGDKVLIKKTHSIREGEIGIFIVDGESYIKQMGKNELISLNPNYPNITLKEYSDCRCVGKVLGILIE